MLASLSPHTGRCHAYVHVWVAGYGQQATRHLRPVCLRPRLHAARGSQLLADTQPQLLYSMLTSVAAFPQVREGTDVLAKKAHGKDESSQHAVATIDPALYY